MKTALLVIDVQRALREGATASFESDRVIERINLVASKARAARALVVFIQHESQGEGLQHGSEGWQLAHGLLTQAGDVFLRKTATDAFHRTELQALLQQHGVEQLAICGMHSEFCVDTTTRRALALGYPVLLVSDAHSTTDKPHLGAAQIIAHHTATLTNISSFGPRARAVSAQALQWPD